MRKANFAIINENSERVLIQDIGPWDKFLTVTNAAEEVVETLAGMLQGRKLHYIDSEGIKDEILIEDGKFAGFAPIESYP